MLHGIDFSRYNVALKIVPCNITLSETSWAWARYAPLKQDDPLNASISMYWCPTPYEYYSLCILRSGKHLRGWLWRRFSAKGVQEENISIHFLMITSAWIGDCGNWRILGMIIWSIANDHLCNGKTDRQLRQQTGVQRGETLVRKRITNNDVITITAR